jgi:hypothetical protein
VARGKNILPDKMEQVMTTVAKLDSKAEAGRVLGMPRETVRDIVARLSEDEYAEIRRLANNEYVLKTWENILKIETAVALRIAGDPTLGDVRFVEMTKALSDLKRTVENVVNNIHIGDNIQNNLDMSLVEIEAVEYLKGLGYKIEKS